MSRRPRPLFSILLLAMLSLSFAPAPCRAGGGLPVVVLGDGARPVAAARVSSWRAGPHGRTLVDSTETDEEGRARVALPSGGPTLLSISAPGYVRAVYERNGSPDGTVTVHLSRGRSVRLTVSDAATGEPVTRFTAMVVPPEAAAAGPDRAEFEAEGINPVTVEDPEGRAELTGIADGGGLLLIHAGGYSPGMRTLTGEETGPVQVRLDDSGCVDRFVVDAATGSPVAGARAAPSAELLEGPLARLAFTFESEESGRITLCPLATPVDRLLVVHPDYAPLEIPGPGAEEGREGALVELRAGGTLAGRLIGVDGLPVVQARVIAESLGLIRKTETDAGGRFELAHIAPGPCRVRIEPTGTPDAGPPLERTVRVEEGMRAELDLDLSGGLTFRILRDELPVVDALLVLLATESGSEPRVLALAKSDADGLARLRGLPAPFPSPGQVLALRRGDRLMFVDPPRADERGADEHPIDLSLPGPEIAGRVVEKGESRPLPGSLVHCGRGRLRLATPAEGPLGLEPAGAAVFAAPEASVTAADERGRFRLPLPDWCERIEVRGPVAGPEDLPWQPASVRVDTVDPDQPLTIELARGRAIDATVIDRAVPPVREIVVELRRPGAPAAVFSTGAPPAPGGARVRLEPPDDGPWLVVARARGRAPAIEGPLPAPPGAPSRVRLFLEEGAVLIVRGLDDRSARGPLRLVDRGGRDLTRFVDVRSGGEEAALSIGPLPLGRYELVTGGESVRVRLDVPGASKEVDLSARLP